MIAELAGVTWFLWSIVTPMGVSYDPNTIRANPVKAFSSKAACHGGLKGYRRAVDEAFPEHCFDRAPFTHGGKSYPASRECRRTHDVQLICSPVNPR